MSPDYCPVCDAEVPAGARACPACGADESTGWSQAAHCDRLGISDPDEPFDYDEFVKNEFGSGRRQKRNLSAFWIVTAAITLVAILIWLL